MNKVLEYLSVAVIAIGIFCGLLTWAFSSSRNGLAQDCERMGQARIGPLHIKCQVVSSDK